MDVMDVFARERAEWDAMTDDERWSMHRTVREDRAQWKLAADRLEHEAEQRRGAVEANRVEEFCQRVNRLGGLRRTEQGGYWIDRDNVLALVEEVFGSLPEPGKWSVHTRRL